MQLSDVGLKLMAAGLWVRSVFFVECFVAEDGFHTGEELIEVVGYFHFLLDLGFVCELSSLIFSSRRCFCSRARAVSWTRSS